MSLLINLFGRFRIYYAQEAVNGFHVRRTQELLTYLLLNRDRPFSREALATLIWEEAEPSQARKYLRQTLWHIQNVLQKATGIAAKELLTVELDWVQLNTSDTISVDLAVFEQAYQSCQGTLGEHLSDAQRTILENAVQLYRGDLLEGCYEDWCIFERERLQNYYLTILQKLVRYYVERAQVDYGVAHAKRVLRYDPADEQTHYHLIHLYWMAGHRTQALRQYQQCKKALTEELGIEPAETTKILYERIRLDLSDFSETSPLVRSPGPSPNTSDFSVLMANFRCLQHQLAAIDEKVKQAINAAAIGTKN